MARPSHILKVVAGLLCLAAALLLVLVAWVSFRWGEPWFKLVVMLLLLGLSAVGLLLILKRRQAMPKQVKALLALFFVLVLASPVLLVAHIRHERWALQARAKAFLARPMPEALKSNAEGYLGAEYVGTNQEAEIQILGHSRALIERYATRGRIRWSARIQGQFASTGEQLWFPGGEDLERTNQEVHAFMAERNALLSEEWSMGFWQWVEDTLELKSSIPEHAEEDFHPAAATNTVSPGRGKAD